MENVSKRPPKGSWFTGPKVALVLVGVVAGVVGKWLLATDTEWPPWLFAVMVIPLAVAELLEVLGRLVRRRQGVPMEALGPVPMGGPPGWRWDPHRARWTPPEP